MKGLHIIQFCSLVLMLSYASFTTANDKSSEQTKTISIIGNSELPKVELALPWRISGSADPTKIELEPEPMPDVLKPISMDEHKRKVYFHHYIQMPKSFGSQ